MVLAGDPKLLKECTLPLTGTGVVDRIITTLGVFDVTDKGLVLVELAPDVTPEEVEANTEAEYSVADQLKRHAA